MSSEDYCNAVVDNVEEILRKKGLQLTNKYNTPMNSGYRPELYVTVEQVLTESLVMASYMPNDLQAIMFSLRYNPRILKA